MLAELLEATKQEGPLRSERYQGATAKYFKYFEKLQESRKQRKDSDGGVRQRYVPSEQLVREHRARRVREAV